MPRQHNLQNEVFNHDVKPFGASFIWKRQPQNDETTGMT
jgi:hypothetical protein